MDKPRDLSPLAVGDLEIGKTLPFPVFDRTGVLLLAAGQAISTQRQLDELAAKGMYHNPRWAIKHTTSRNQMGTVGPSVSTFKTTASKLPTLDIAETGVNLQMNLPGQADIFPVRLVGTLSKDAFVVTHPIKDESFIFIKEGQVCEFRSFDGLAIYRFSASVEKVQLSPHALLILSWPHDAHWEAKPIRASRRIACEVPVAAKQAGQGLNSPVTNGQIRNLSTGGVEFEAWSYTSWQVGTALILAFQLACGGRKYLLELHAKVIKEMDSDGSRHQHFGLVFDVVSDENFIVLHSFVCEQMVRRLESPLYAIR